MRDRQRDFMTVPLSERADARRFAQLLRAVLLHDIGKVAPSFRAAFTAADGTRVEAELSRETLRIIERTVERAASGDVLLMGRDDVLTPQEAARRLGVSRSFLTRQMDAGRLPYHLVGTHRRVKASDLMAFAERLAASDTAMRRLIDNAEALPDIE